MAPAPTPTAQSSRTPAAALSRAGVRLVAVAVLLACGIAGVGAFLAWRNERADRDRQIEQSAIFARAAAAESDRFLRDRLDLLDVLAASPAVRGGDVEGMKSLFRLVASRQPGFATILWADPSAIVLATAQPDSGGPPVNLSDRDYVIELKATGQPAVSAAVIGRFTNKPVVVLAVPTTNDAGQVTGFLAGGITLDALEKTLEEFRLGESGVLRVVDRAGQLIVDADQTTAITNVAGSPLVQRARAERRNVLTDAPNLRGDTGRLIAFADAPVGDWLVFVDRSGSEAFGPARRTLIGTLIALFGISLLGVVGAVWAGRQVDNHARAQRRALDASEELARDNARLFQREQEARRVAENAQVRMAFLAEASAVLAGSLDYEATLAKISRLAVPKLADWCAVHVVTDENTIQRTGLAHADPTKEELLRNIRQRYPLERNPAHPVVRAVHAGERTFSPEISPELLGAISRDEGQLALLQQVGITSYMCVPLVARGRRIGAVAFVLADPVRRYTADDLALADDLAGRAALAVDNARLYQEAQSALKVRDDFLTAVSHDLRTPLTPIKSFAQFLQRRIMRDNVPNPETLLEGLRTIDSNASRMMTLVGQLLDLARLQSGRPLALDPRPTDLIKLARTEVEQFSPMAERHQIKLEATEASVKGEWDPDRLERVLGNLLSNAIKYSPHGGDIVISISRDDDGWATLSVRDHGVGIPEDDLPRIFEPFYRGGNVGSITGTGVGLAGAKQIIEQHHGTLELESEEDAGTTVTIRLPLDGRPPIEPDD